MVLSEGIWLLCISYSYSSAHSRKSDKIEFFLFLFFNLGRNFCMCCLLVIQKKSINTSPSPPLCILGAWISCNSLFVCLFVLSILSCSFYFRVSTYGYYRGKDKKKSGLIFLVLQSTSFTRFCLFVFCWSRDTFEY